MQFQFFELHVQHAIWETRLHVQTSTCMSISELHVKHAVWCIIRWVRSNSNNKMHVDKVWCFWICTSQSNPHVQHVILFLSDMHIEVSHMHVWHADRRCWMHVGHHTVQSKIDTNMGMLFLFDVFNMSIWYTGALPTWIYLFHSAHRHLVRGAVHVIACWTCNSITNCMSFNQYVWSNCMLDMQFHYSCVHVQYVYIGQNACLVMNL